MSNGDSSSQSAWPVAVFVATLVVLLLLIVRLFVAPDVPSALVIAIAAITGLLILSPRVFELAELTLSKDGLVAKINKVEEKIESTEKVVKNAEKKIDQIFANTMSDSMFENLQKLSSGNFGNYKNDGGLRRELRHLRDVGYVTVKGHIDDLPREGTNLSEFVNVTDVGKDFVTLRENLQKKA